HRAFGHGVCKPFGNSRGAGDGSHIQDHPAVMLLHMTNAGLQAVIKAFYIDLKNPVEVGLRGAFQGANMRDASIVNKNIYAPAAENFLEFDFKITWPVYIE